MLIMFNFQKLKKNITNITKKIIDEKPIDQEIILYKKKLNSLKKKIELCDENFKEKFARKFNSYYSYNKPLILLVFCNYITIILDAPHI